MTQILSRPGAAEASFEARVLAISDRLQGMFYDTGFDRAAARVNSKAALEMWLELYLSYYLSPPPSMQKQARWRDLMDSITGPLRRIQLYAQEESFHKGHHQLRVLQDSLTEFYGPPPNRKAARLGPLFHTLETLQYVEGTGNAEARERRARIRLLAERWRNWYETWPAPVQEKPAFLSFAKQVRLLETTEQDGNLPDLVAESLRQFQPLLKAALRAQWSRPKKPSP